MMCAMLRKGFLTLPASYRMCMYAPRVICKLLMRRDTGQEWATERACAMHSQCKDEEYQTHGLMGALEVSGTFHVHGNDGQGQGDDGQGEGQEALEGL